MEKPNIHNKKYWKDGGTSTFLYEKYMADSDAYINNLEKQLSICDVVSSLPSKEEMEIGLETLMAYKEDSFKTEYDKITFKFGFRTCFNWLSKRKTK